MLIEATTQTTEGHVYIIDEGDDLHVGTGVTIRSTTTDAVTTWTGAHVFTVDGTIIGQDDGINTIGCEQAQTVIIRTGGRITSGGDGVITDADGIILDGIGSSITNAGRITSYGSAASLFVRDAGTTTVTNSGIMDGRVAGIWHKFGIGTMIVTNSGTITSANHAILGGESADLITNTGTLRGIVDLGAGNDVLVNRVGTIVGAILGGDGDDRFVIGTKAENIDAGAGIDTLDISQQYVGVTVDLTTPANNLGSPVVGDTLIGFENVIGSSRADVLRGDAGENLLQGGAGVDVLVGNDGVDTLEGGTAADSLTGGVGVDVFLYTTSAGMSDKIMDFVSGADQIRLEGSAFGYGATTGAVAAADFVTGTTRNAQDATDHFIFRTTDTTLWYDTNGNASGGQYLIADLQAGATVTAADLWLI